jgi:hypothetical protein
MPRQLSQGDGEADERMTTLSRRSSSLALARPALRGAAGLIEDVVGPDAAEDIFFFEFWLLRF